MKHKSPCRNLLHAVLTVVFISTAVSRVVGQETKIALPRVAGASVPLYPPLARAANVQGVIHVKITTDGHRTVNARAEDGPKLLAVAAEENARTWFFAAHEPTTFTVTYRYKLVPGMKGNPDSPEIVLRLPSEVEVRTLPTPLNGDPPSSTR
jgi:hypothetical protein